MPDRLPGALVLSILWLAGCPGESSVDKGPEESAVGDSAAEDTNSETGCVPADEVPYDGVDQDCDGSDLVDADLDGHPSDTVEGGTDCDDTDSTSYPGAEERCDGADNDCDGEIDEHTWYQDHDSDGWGNENVWYKVCEQPEGYVANSDDCNDARAEINPDATEVCDGLDNDCDGEVDGPSVESTWYTDADRDGYGADGSERSACSAEEGEVAVAGDCDDADSTVYTGHTEDCDGLDNDCDGVVPTDELDADGDGERACEGDCDDADPLATSSRVEICGDGIDNDCDGTADDDSCSDCDAVVPDGEPTIHDAIGAASAGDTICVQPGTYAENLNFGGAEISVIGLAGPESTIIDGGGDDSVVIFESGEGSSTLLQGFTLTNGAAYYGTGVRISASGPTLEDLIIKDNGGALLGAAIYVKDGTPMLSHMVLRDNDAGYSLGSSETGYGGGLYVTSSDVLLDNVTVQDNSACSGGGGLVLDDSTVTLTHVLVTGNLATAGVGGGGLYVHGGAVSLTNVILVDNHAYAGRPGGGVYASGSSLSLTNVTVCDNHSQRGGGGMALYSSDVAFTNLVLCSNWTDDTESGGIYASSTSTADITYGDVWDNDPGDFDGVTDPTGTDGNLEVDPEHLDDTWHLADTSPLIDAGDPDLLDPDGTSSDMGAWGGPEADGWDLDGDGYNAWWLPGDYDATTSPDLDCNDQESSVYPGSGC